MRLRFLFSTGGQEVNFFFRGGSQQRHKYSDDYHRVCRRNGIHETSAAMASTYYATVFTALCALPARVLEFDRLLHTPPHPPSEPRLPPQPKRCCSHPIPGSHSRPPHAAASITTTVQIRPPITALNLLRPIAPAFVCWYSLTTAYGAPTVSTGRHPKTPLSAVKYFFGYWPRRTYPTTLRLR